MRNLMRSSVILLSALCAGRAAGAADEHVRTALSSRALPAYIVIPQARTVSLAPQPAQVRISRVDARVEIIEQTSATTLSISLENPSNQRLEAELLVPVPDQAAVRSFTFQGSSAEPTAQLLKKEEARRIYDQIVSQVRDPALLEFAGYNLIRSSVFPVEPRGQQRVQLTYEHILTADGPRVDYVLPRSESLEYNVPWNVTVSIAHTKPVSTVYSPSHPLSVVRPSANRIVARMSEHATTEPGPFRLSYMIQQNGVTASLIAYPDPSVGGGYFMLLAGLPPKSEAAPESKPLKREVTLVFDRSGSMNGEKMGQVREAAMQVIAGLEPGECFNVIAFNEAVDAFSQAPVPKNDENVKRARDFLKGIQSRGGTNIHDALLEAMRQKPTEGTLPIVLFLTDGLPTVGQTTESVIRELAVKSNPHQRRIFTFGVGVDVNTPLLTKVADLTRATATFVLPKEDVEVKVGQVFKRLEGPVLATPLLTVVDEKGQPVPGRTRDLLPSRLPDLFEGDQLVLLGQYINEEPLHLNLAGNYLGTPKTFRFSFTMEKATTRNAFVPRLWASRKIGVLIDEIRTLGADQGMNQTQLARSDDPRVKELVTEVVKLSQEFGILTEYTAFLAREGTDLTDVNGNGILANDRFNFRAVGQRSGYNAVSQDTQLQIFRGQSTLNGRNRLGQGKGEELQSVQFSNVQQFNDNAFFNDGQRWVNSRAAMQQRKLEPKKTIEFGSGEFSKLVERLVKEGRQSSIALRGEILLDVDGETVLIRNPLVPNDLAAAGAAPAAARRMDVDAARELMEAKQ
jgi:Ca-activated chloride channel family protein